MAVLVSSVHNIDCNVRDLRQLQYATLSALATILATVRCISQA